MARCVGNAAPCHEGRRLLQDPHLCSFSGASPRKTDSFSLVKPTGVSTCKDLLRTSVRKQNQAIRMAIKMEQPAEDILLQAAKTIGPGLRR